MTGNELAALCAAQEGQAYLWGGLGYEITETRISQLRALYPSVYTDAYVSKCRKNLGKRGFDCAGLVKHFLWGNSGDGVLRHYAANGIPDTTANGLFALCGFTGAVSSLPEKPGLLIWKEGHVGVYLGAGRLAEARGIDYGVVLSGISGRGFEKWGELPGILYESPQSEGKTISLAGLAQLLAGQGIGAITL